MIIFQRSFCAVTHEYSIREIYNFKHFPVSMSCVETPESQDLFCDMTWGVGATGLVQLIKLLDPNLIYGNYHSPGTVGKIWKEHHYNLFKFISQDRYQDVLEIGGASGLLAENFCQTDSKFSWTIIEPSKNRKISDPRVEFIENYFENWPTTKKFDTIVHSHVLEHAYNPVDFLSKTNGLLKAGGFQYISIPNMRRWLSQGYSNTLSFEHTFYLDDLVLDCLLTKTGFQAIEWKINEHSIFVKAVKTDDVIKLNHSFSYSEILFNNYVKRQQQDVQTIKEKLAGREFYLFGAHIFSQSLFNFGLDQKQVINLLDNDTNKHNKRLYGTPCIVKSPACLENVKNPIVVLRGGSYTREITESLLKINPNIEVI